MTARFFGKPTATPVLHYGHTQNAREGMNDLAGTCRKATRLPAPPYDNKDF